MNVDESKQELFHMVVHIKIDFEVWHHNMLKGRDVMRQISTVQMKIFENEERLINGGSAFFLRLVDRRLRDMYQRRDILIDMMKDLFEALRRHNASTQCMLSRVRMWHDDELIRDHYIALNFSTTQFLEFLEFLASRYEAEYEVKEVVVLNLHRMRNAHDVDILESCWRDCIHAGGEEFQGRFQEFFLATTRRNMMRNKEQPINSRLRSSTSCN
ncbi:uncharacterized protein LOC115632961 [Scaptodrosophila lebanonensis]|uniref:Uncharacterized protein LOC115632961 n=1 Tax=Drosophila lebanonensis TaxID=7225 RepID=A0A6J2UCC9_DROLE|nr:uncharacterized protein LOC115632961 [Scaptodrosophila lebanonensis]